MRLSKTVEVAVGIAVSGGMLLVLSGGAFAADGGASTSTQSTEKSVVNNSVTTVDGESTVGKGTNVSVTNSSDKPAADGAASDSSKPGALGVSQTTIANVADAEKTKLGASILPSDATTTKAEAVVAGGLVAADKTDKPVTGEPAGSVAGVSQAVTDTTPAKQGAIETMVINSMVYPIQPKITTTRPVVIEDLATQVPTAAERQSVPGVPAAPSQSSGLLSRLSAGLAGSVVPPVFLTPDLGIVALAVEFAAILILSILTLGRVALSIGAFQRQEGFAHAPRSDVAESSAFSFATPLSLSYVPAHVPRHSSFLVVSETKTVRLSAPNAIRKEEMR